MLDRLTVLLLTEATINTLHAFLTPIAITTTTSTPAKFFLVHDCFSIVLL